MLNKLIAETRIEVGRDLERPDFEKLGSEARTFTASDRRLRGTIPTIAITPVVDGRTGAYEPNQAGTWQMANRVYDLIKREVRLADGIAPRIVVAPEIVYGAPSGARAMEYYKQMGVGANIWVSRSWSYSDELFSNMLTDLPGMQQLAYGLNQTDRPGAVWLKAFCAAMDAKRLPIFSVYNPDLESEKGDLTDYVSKRLVRFARCASAVMEMQNKNYLSVGSVSMGIIGSDVLRNVFQKYLGMGVVNVDMANIHGRIENRIYDKQEFEKAFQFMKDKFAFDYAYGQHDKPHRPRTNNDLLAYCIKMTMVVRDLMIGNPNLSDAEYAQGHNAIAAGTQGQRATDFYPNYDLTESLLCSNFDWNGFRQAFVVATENDSLNGIGMLLAHLLTGTSQLFADIRTNWTPQSILAATGIDVTGSVPRGLIDKRNSGAGALEFATNLFEITGETDVYKAAARLTNDPAIQEKLINAAIKGTTYTGADLVYFPADGLSSRYQTPMGRIPMTSYRYTAQNNELVASIVEGETVDMDPRVAGHISKVTNESWPATYWQPRDMPSYEYMGIIGANHDGNTFGHIGGDMLTLNSMLRIPVDFHNIPASEIFFPTGVNRIGPRVYPATDQMSVYQITNAYNAYVRALKR